MGGVILEMTGVAKAFGPTVALGGVDLQVRRGEVHALLGENGAGKSTLMKVLAGVHRPDAGRIALDGAAFAPRSPLAARDAGVAMIYQELNLAPHLSVAANISLGREPTALGFVRGAAARSRAAAALATLGHTDIAPDQLVGALDPGGQQLVEIARALAHRAKLLVLDEPTSSLGADDAQRLFAVIRRLAGEGLGVIYISHFLEEVSEVADRFTVLRDGRVVGRGAVADTSTGALVALMAGRDIGAVYPARAPRPGPVRLALEAVAGRRGRPGSTSLELRAGEILGISGLVGAGRTALLRCVFGLDPLAAGTVRVDTARDRGAPPRRRLEQGVGMLAEDRQNEGLALSRSVAENITLGAMQRFSTWGWFRPRRRAAVVRPWLDRLHIKTRGPDQPVAELSGGNQQKVALARLLHDDALVLLLDEPTRGVDVASKAEIYRAIAALAAEGKAVLVVSSYAPELLGLCDRIAVMHRGRLGAPRPASAWSEHELLAAAVAGEASR